MRVRFVVMVIAGQEVRGAAECCDPFNSRVIPAATLLPNYACDGFGGSRRDATPIHRWAEIRWREWDETGRIGPSRTNRKLKSQINWISKSECFVVSANDFVKRGPTTIPPAPR